jgi:hypothetical protein
MLPPSGQNKKPRKEEQKVASQRKLIFKTTGVKISKSLSTDALFLTSAIATPSLAIVHKSSNRKAAVTD